MSGRTYHDPLHGAIRLERSDPAEALAIALIDTAPFQRLRRIRQLGPAYLTFHGAEFSRFTHSLGVLHLARLALAQLAPHHPELLEHRGVLYAAALLHDVGHGPLSHSGEEMYGLNHEAWSGRLVREHPQLRGLLESHAEGCADAVADLLEHGRYPVQAIKALVSSQLDCDRLDYLQRDGYSTGASYGRLDLQRILAALTLAPDGALAVQPKGLMAVEHYLVVRNLMYRSVYNHRLNVVCNWLLRRLISVARQLGPGRVWADAVMGRWLWERGSLDLASFLANDDIRTGYHLERWQEEGPKELADPCRRLLERRLLKATDVASRDRGSQLELLAQARTLASQAGFDPDGCCALEQRQTRGYHPYAGGLRLWDGRTLQALEQRSPLVHSLSEPAQLAWLIHPAEVAPKLRRFLDS
ncbi:HD domain-containing protein [Cyanobium sp. LEGE 06113]|uniref:HD domain-containing protein n=1 Tax=Cyanobium sp. LEGE 06113 TaxID=1297573 RepID=UPI00187EFBAC|nr:HD domain-containing protein [Cyanobium sp. LEGE 06113]MBE9154637.1 HD domain-containing protein [Cyanobium sp. LEGE 06113]